MRGMDGEIITENQGPLNHQPVLVKEVINGLITSRKGIYVDATFGRGGHTKEILKLLTEDSVLICIDRDQEAIDVANQFDDRRLIIRHGEFSKLRFWLEELGYLGKVDGILADLGVSSPQLDQPSRGFSFLRDGPLDMRMDQRQLIQAKYWLNSANEREIGKVLRSYGEERFSKCIAKAIIRERKICPINTTVQLAKIVSEINSRWEEHKHPATRTFQAIRMFINDELGELRSYLEQALEIIRVRGRLAVITFHSLEDRVVKSFITKHRNGGVPEWAILRDKELNRCIAYVEKGIRASSEEVSRNPRSRSAKLTLLEKLK